MKVAQANPLTASPWVGAILPGIGLNRVTLPVFLLLRCGPRELTKARRGLRVEDSHFRFRKPN